MKIHVQPHSLTVKWNGIARELKSEAIVISIVDRTISKNITALWDTGATNSVISTKLASKLNLPPVGITRVNGVGGVHETRQFLVSIQLQNKVTYSPVLVTEGDFADFDLLIGMDIIATGSFAVTNKNNCTWMSFSHPSVEHVDYVQKYPIKKQGNPRAWKKR